MAHDVFISHSSEDKVVADTICSALESEKIRCWVAPRDIKPGHNWAEAITEAIEKSNIMVLIFSSNSNNSKEVIKELTLASTAGLVVIPFRIELIEPSGAMKYYLSDVHWLDAVNPPTQRQIDDLVERVKPLVEIVSIEKPYKGSFKFDYEKEEKDEKKYSEKSVESKIEYPLLEEERSKDSIIESELKSKKTSLGKKKIVGITITFVIIVITIITITYIVRNLDYSGSNEIVEETDEASPVAFLRGPYESFIGNQIEFDASESIDKDGNIVEYVWDFGDGSNYVGSEKIVNHTYNQKGNYTVKLTVMDDKGNISVTSTTVIINEKEILEGRILLSSERDGNPEIYIMNIDGSDLQRLTENNYANYSPAISSGGSKIVFSSGNYENYDIYMMNIDGSGLIQLTNNDVYDYSPSFSPDGSRIVFSSGGSYGSGNSKNFEIYTMNSDGSDWKQLTDDIQIDGGPSFSPDGSKIVFNSSGSNEDTKIYTMNSDGSDRRQLTDKIGAYYPSFSPDGSKIVFFSKQEIYIMNTDGSNLMQLTNNDYYDSDPSFSPDSSRIIFTSRRGEKDFDIYIMNIDGSGLLKLTDNDYNEHYPILFK